MKLSNRKTGGARKIELAMTSMIDVIFLLLIFFMVNASFHLTERNLESAIQTKSQTASPARANLEPVIVEIVPVGGDYAFKVGGRQIDSAPELAEVLRQFPNKGDGAFVRVNDDAPFRMAAAAIQACSDAGFVSVSYIPITAGS
jgi:biopolymer transport protein ExbD